MFSIRGKCIPERMMDGINRYVEYGIIPGDFLQAVIRNNLHDAFSFADDENFENLAAFAGYFHNEVPSNAWGSTKRMLQWAEDGGLLGMGGE